MKLIDKVYFRSKPEDMVRVTLDMKVWEWRKLAKQLELDKQRMGHG